MRCDRKGVDVGGVERQCFEVLMSYSWNRNMERDDSRRFSRGFDVEQNVSCQLLRYFVCHPREQGEVQNVSRHLFTS